VSRQTAASVEIGAGQANHDLRRSCRRRIHVVERAEPRVGDVVIYDDDGRVAIRLGAEGAPEAARIAGIQGDHGIPRPGGCIRLDVDGAWQELIFIRHAVGGYQGDAASGRL
jgi:hypothetical protein